MPNPKTSAAAGAMKITIPVKASEFPLDIVPDEGPVPQVRFTIGTERGPTLTAELSGKSYRRAVKTARERLAGGDDPTVIIQGNLVAGNVLQGAGISVPPPPSVRIER
jgi:hypothetical protein